jgi:putative ATP-dependent endonuclease of the OLD family
MKLDSISICGFRSVAGLHELRVGKPTLLTGHNDAGKSTILEAVRFLLNDYVLGNDDPTYEVVTPTAGELTPRVPETWVEGTFALSATEQTDLALSASVRIRRISRTGGASVYELYSALPDDVRLQNYDKLLAPELKELVTQLGLTSVSTKKADLLDALAAAALAGPSTDAWVGAPAGLVKALPRVERFNPSGSTDAEESIRNALMTVYRGFVEEDTFRGEIADLEKTVSDRLVTQAAAMREHIMQRCSDIGDVQILPAVSLTAGLKATQISVTGKAGEIITLGHSGAGRARRISLAVWEFNTVLLPGSGDVVMLYDEPDTHLDYAHQREFMELVHKQCALDNVRMFIATHSMNLIDGIDIADVIHVRHVDDRTVAERLTDQTEIGQHLGAVAAALGLRNTVLLNERLFVGVEGATETAALPVLFRLATGQQLEAQGIALWACDNNEGAVLFAEFLVSHGRKVAFLVDADSKTNTKHVFSDRRLASRNLDPDVHGLYIGDPNEIEDVFGNDLWASVANARWPRNDGRAWNEQDIQTMREQPKFSKELETNFRASSDVSLSGKPAMVRALSLHLTDAEQIPQQLRDLFQELIARAN